MKMHLSTKKIRKLLKMKNQSQKYFHSPAKKKGNYNALKKSFRGRDKKNLNFNLRKRTMKRLKGGVKFDPDTDAMAKLQIPPEKKTELGNEFSEAVGEGNTPDQFTKYQAEINKKAKGSWYSLASTTGPYKEVSRQLDIINTRNAALNTMPGELSVDGIVGNSDWNGQWNLINIASPNAGIANILKDGLVSSIEKKITEKIKKNEKKKKK